MSIWYFGTPGFAVAPLKALVDSGEKVSLVVTQPDRPAGRGGTTKAPEVKEFAVSHGLAVWQPAKVRDPEVLIRFRDLAHNEQPELAVVTAFGQIIPQELLEIPERGFWNIHASLLPALRGASPIQAAITGGLDETGITLMQMDQGLDTGDILLTKTVHIGPEMTGGELHDLLAPVGASILMEGLALARSGHLHRTPQDNSRATYASKLTRGHGTINWSGSAGDIVNQVRGLNPWPSAQTTLNGERIKIHRVRPVEGTGSPGEIISYNPLTVACGDGAIEVIELQREGKRALPAPEFVRGLKTDKGSRFGT